MNRIEKNLVLDLKYLAILTIIRDYKKKEHKILLLELVLKYISIGHAFFASDNNNNIDQSCEPGINLAN